MKTKKYKLLKDLPDLKAGAIFEAVCVDSPINNGNVIVKGSDVTAKN